jgi:hypothetical protein
MIAGTNIEQFKRLVAKGPLDVPEFKINNSITVPD